MFGPGQERLSVRSSGNQPPTIADTTHLNSNNQTRLDSTIDFHPRVVQHGVRPELVHASADLAGCKAFWTLYHRSEERQGEEAEYHAYLLLSEEEQTRVAFVLRSFFFFVPCGSRDLRQLDRLPR